MAGRKQAAVKMQQLGMRRTLPRRDDEGTVLDKDGLDLWRDLELLTILRRLTQLKEDVTERTLWNRQGSEFSNRGDKTQIPGSSFPLS